jgi:hypothetical protein
MLQASISTIPFVFLAYEKMLKASKGARYDLALR